MYLYIANNVNTGNHLDQVHCVYPPPLKTADPSYNFLDTAIGPVEVNKICQLFNSLCVYVCACVGGIPPIV